MNQTSLQDQRGSPVPPCRPLTANQGSYVQNFSQAMCRAGLSFNEDIIADGAIHRFPTGKKDNKDGWYVFYGMAGAFGDWSRDLHEKWSLKEEILPSPEKEKLHIQIEKSKRIAEEERQSKHEKAALTALEKWNSFSEQGHSPSQKHGCPVIFPVFKNTDTKPTDFNDLHVLEGLSVVKEQLKQVLQSIEWPEPTPLNAIKNELSPVVSLPPALIPEPYQDWLIDIAERMQCPLDYVAVG
ncbi:MAG: hypothetical protein K2W92_05565, partial [Alphaproteobacteria bacterium]|nr:hypothetical protein [Alphaproteobacteria bacterium]